MIDFVLLLIATLYFFNVGWMVASAITATAFLWLVYMAWTDYKYEMEHGDEPESD